MDTEGRGNWGMGSLGAAVVLVEGKVGVKPPLASMPMLETDRKLLMLSDKRTYQT